MTRTLKGRPNWTAIWAWAVVTVLSVAFWWGVVEAICG